MSERPILVSGCGSIGRRHIGNLRTLGFTEIAVCDPDPERLAFVEQQHHVNPYRDFDKALKAVQPEIVLICTPPVLHLAQALKAVTAGAHVFIEKPLSHTLDQVDRLRSAAQSRQRVIQVGYNLRFHPGVTTLKRLVDEGTIGRVLWARAEVGQYLPDWRPWQDYRQSYTARRELGGGIILDASHELDYVLWLLGEPSRVLCMAEQVSRLEVDVEDCATLLVRFHSGAQADIHLDFIQRTYTRVCKLVGETGTLEWDYSAMAVRILRPDGVETLPYTFEANAMYIHELEHFLGLIDAGGTGNFDEAAQTLQLALAAHESAERGCEVTL